MWDSLLTFENLKKGTEELGNTYVLFAFPQFPPLQKIVPEKKKLSTVNQYLVFHNSTLT